MKCWTSMHKNLKISARKSRHEHTMVWTWTQESLDMNTRAMMNRRQSGKKHKSLVNAENCGAGRTEFSKKQTTIWSSTHEWLFMNAGEGTVIRNLVKAPQSGKRTNVRNTHKSLETEVRNQE